MSNGITKEQLEVHDRLMNDYEYFARHIQRIDPKDLIEEDPELKQLQESILSFGEEQSKGLVPLVFQPGQAKLHKFVTEQKLRRGKVRVALVKPRQVGWSTYIQGRAHWLATKTPSLKVFIVSHNTDSTRKFLRRARTFCSSAPASIQAGRPVENAKELLFDNGASYAIATAGSPDAMRSDACHFLHGSEVPFWENMQDNLGAIIPALSGGRGSEGFLESTSKGKGNAWHKFIMDSLKGQTEFEVFFDAWFNHPKYRATPPPGWQPEGETLEAVKLYGLDIEQAYWRAMMAAALRAEWLFKQEYPGTIEESFQSSGDNLINPDAVFRARKNVFIADPYMPLILGCDPARTGDRTVIAPRQGDCFGDMEIYPKMDDAQLVGILAGYLNNGFRGQYVSKIFIDYAIGEGVASMLRKLGHDRIISVGFGDGASDPRYLNKRAEMAIALRDWFGDGYRVSIPDNDDVAADIAAIPDFTQGNTTDKIQLVPKKDIKSDCGFSPDIFDAMILTFAYPVAGERSREMQKFFKDHFEHIKSVTELTSLLNDFAF